MVVKGDAMNSLILFLLFIALILCGQINRQSSAAPKITDFPAEEPVD